MNSIRPEDLAPPVKRLSLAISHRILRDSLACIRHGFSEYDVLPIKMLGAHSPDVICTDFPAALECKASFTQGGAWWAYAFGHSEEMPKNDVPNISAFGMPWGFDLAVNAELRTSQAVMRKRISAAPEEFDELLKVHRGTQLQALLKLEHQPRFYHWVSIAVQNPGYWNAGSLLDLYGQFENEYLRLKTDWTQWLLANNTHITTAQAKHMRERNKQLNLALRLVRHFPVTDSLWNMRYEQQVEHLVSECERIKPLIDFFQL